MNESNPAPLTSSTSTSTGTLVLSFPFRNRRVPVTFVSSVPFNHAQLAVQSEPFITWYRRCEKVKPNNKRIEIHSVCIQSVDLFGARKVGFIKIVSDCSYFDGKQHHEKKLPGICFLRGNAVSIFVALFCDESSGDGSTTITNEYSILVEQPRVPIGVASILELPAGMIDDENESVAGIAVKEMQEECGINIIPSDLIDLTELALEDVVQNGRLPIAALPPSGGGCDEFVRYMYLEKKVTTAQLDAMKGRLSGLHDHGEYITLSVVPMQDVWKVSGDSKAMISLFLLDQLRKEGKLPKAGMLATPLTPESSRAPVWNPPSIPNKDPTIKLNDKSKIPQLAYGLYLVPNDDSGEQTITNAILAGYRHFDCASIYGNEAIVGKAIRKSGIPRDEFCIATKVWKDALKEGPEGVRKSVIESLNRLDCGGYVDICYIHWPVPGHFVPAYHELESIYDEGKLRSIGLSNFSPDEYETLVRSGISVLPVVNQLEVSPVMYRPEIIEFFRSRDIAVVAFKPLNRGGAFESTTIQDIAARHCVSCAQVMLRWCVQKGLIVICKTSNAQRMITNRSIFNFSLVNDEMIALDALTTDLDRRQREEHELQCKLE